MRNSAEHLGHQLQLLAFGLCCLIGFYSSPATAGPGGGGNDIPISIQDEYRYKVSAARSLAPLDDSLFGDAINSYSGAIQFSITDVTLPGNSALPVTLARRFEVEDVVGKRPGVRGAGRSFKDWDFDIPYVQGTFAAGIGWVAGDGQSNRCAQSNASLAAPPATGVFDSTDYWHGNFLYIPGHGQDEILHSGDTNPNRPTDGLAYHWVTKGRWYFSCLASVDDGYAGDAFLARGPDGTKYWFNHMVVHGSPTAKKGLNVLYRSQLRLLPTRIEDRFGNWVIFSYSTVEPRNITAITASDGRQLTVAYGSAADGTPTTDGSGFVRTVSDGVRTWTYEYINGQDGRLTGVTLPDGSKWVYNFAEFHQDLTYPSPAQCGGIPGFPTPSSFAVSITHPSGATGTFSFEYRRVGRTFVPQNCWQLNDGSGITGDRIPRDFVMVFLTSKVISGPGILSKQWTFSTVSSGSGYDWECAAQGCPTTKVAKVIEPDGSVTLRTFGIQYGVNDGLLVKTERTAADGMTVINSVASSFVTSPSGQSYLAPVGTAFKLFNEPTDGVPRPMWKQQITQQNTNFNWQVNNTAGVYSFDAYANPLTVTRSSSGGAGGNFSRLETTAYYHDTAKWVLGQVASVTDGATGEVMSLTAYDAALDLPISTSRFGIVQQTMGYNTDGTLATVKDGLNHTINLSSWYRGVPRTIGYPTSVSESAVVNLIGTIASTTDELGNTHGYTYDAMGRLANIVYPTGDTTIWNNTSRSFVSVAATEYGLPAGHWKQTESTGNGRISTFYDAMWRPVLVLTEDTTSSSSKSFVVRRYDAAGRKVFDSYPVGSLTSINDSLSGVTTVYDTLGRIVQIKQDSELGVLTTTAEYLAGFQTRVTNPRGYKTTTSYQIFDAPSTDAPVSIISAVGQPEQQTTTIARDSFGLPLTVTRTGPGG